MVTKGRAGELPERLREIDRFFDGSSPVHQAMQALAGRLQVAGIAYAVMGGRAVNAHGAGRTTRDLDVLLTPEGLEEFRRRFVGPRLRPGPEPIAPVHRPADRRADSPGHRPFSRSRGPGPFA